MTQENLFEDIVYYNETSNTVVRTRLYLTTEEKRKEMNKDKLYKSIDDIIEKKYKDGTIKEKEKIYINDEVDNKIYKITIEDIENDKAIETVADHLFKRDII